MWKNSKANFKEIAKDAKVLGASVVCLAKDTCGIFVAFYKDMKDIVNDAKAKLEAKSKTTKSV